MGKMDPKKGELLLAIQHTMILHHTQTCLCRIFTCQKVLLKLAAKEKNLTLSDMRCFIESSIKLSQASEIYYINR
jgi:hypothetical protein